MTTRYMTTGTAARALGLSIATLRRMCERGAVPGAYRLAADSWWQVPAAWVLDRKAAVEEAKAAIQPVRR